MTLPTTHVHGVTESPIDRRSFLHGTASMVAAAALATGDQERSRTDVREGELRVQRLSWAGVKLELGDTTFLIDPWTDKSIWDGAWKDAVVPVTVNTRHCSAMITHLHNDHFEPALLKDKITDYGHVFCFRDVATTIASRGLRVWPLSIYEPFTYRDFTVAPVPAVDGVGALQVAWVISGGGRRIIHCGDGVWHGGVWQIGRQYGPFDMAFVPINGADLVSREPRAGVPLTATPAQAAAFASVLNARLACPIHYGMTDPASYVEYPKALPTFLEEARARGVAVEIARPGDWITWQSKP